ncbi:MAG: neutral/alkaline non-lysosomal ceramidase N-terminal domain-containing protein, partial [Myxococcota bacterium]
MRRLLPLAATIFLLPGCKPETENQVEPGPLMAGMATVRLPAPLGIGTSGYGPFGAPSSTSPFADLYPATTRLHSHPEIRALVLSRGEGFELVFVRIDAVGIFQQLRSALVLELEERLGKEMDDAVFLAATHTHAGPGRLVAEGGLFDLIADSFLPEFYERMLDAMAGAVEAAFDDLAPARVGHVMGLAEDAHVDRRCEDGTDYTNSSLPVVAVERDGRIEALLLSFAVHGTVLGIDDLTLSREVPGAIEHSVEELFEHPVHVMMFTAWAGDMAPGSPEVERRDGAAIPNGYDRMEQVGVAVAAAVDEALADLELHDEPELASRTYRTRIDREILGYDDETFPYPYGGIYCNSEADCEAPAVQEELDENCMAFPEDQPAPDQTEFSTGRIGDLFLMTFTGEPVTTLAEYVMEGMHAQEGVEDVMFLGYTQDYMGYSLLEEDWWYGGYEAGGSLWGPRQGQYLADFAIEAFDSFMEGEPLTGQPVPWPPFVVEAYDEYEPAS